MAARDMQGFPVRTELDAKLRRGALDLQAMVDRAIAAGKAAPRTIDPVDAADAMAVADAAKRAVARARARRGVLSPGSRQARSCTVREKKAATPGTEAAH